MPTIVRLLTGLGYDNASAGGRTLAVLLACIVVTSALFTGIGFAGTQVGSSDDGSVTARTGTTRETDVSSTLTGLVDLEDSPTKLTGTESGQQSGWSVTSVGDVNGDGEEDVAVSAPFSDANGNDSGAVYLFYGPVETGDVELSDADATLVGENEGDWAGFSVDGGDLNGDGESEVVVGAPRADDAGAVYVVEGDESLSGTVSLADAGATVVGESEDDRAGWSVAARSVSNASESSIAVGAPTNEQDPERGGAYLLSRETAASADDRSDAGTKLGGEQNGDRAGWSVDWAGADTEDNGSQVLVGARWYDSDDGDNAGASYLVDSESEPNAT